VCAALILLLAGLAAVQYTWSQRVAEADVQREKEHLEAAATLFANEFNRLVGQAAEYVQNDARSALKNGERLSGVPKLIGELYYLEIPPAGSVNPRQLRPDGFFVSAPAPDWIGVSHCAALAMEEPTALVAPVFELPGADGTHPKGTRVLRIVRGGPDRCFVAKIDRAYVRDAVLPQLITRTFGATAAREYDFAVIAPNHPRDPVYGVAGHADLRKRFFSLSPSALAVTRRSPGDAHGIVVQRVESTTVVTSGPGNLVSLFGPGLWELQVAHKEVPLAAAFERRQRRDLLLSVAVEALLVAAVIFIVVGARRMQRLADQKMQFVAGVSHELRTPVSAITMLSRNQADGLVSGTEKVKQYGELIHQQSRRLNEMVEQTLQYAGIHSGLRRPARVEVDLAELIREAVEARRGELTRAGFEIEVALSPDLPRVSGDPSLLWTAFDNLLSNALKHAGAGRWMRVSAEYLAADREVRISVEDRGAGIDPVDQAEIFEPFSRGRAAVEAQIPGSGLGLSLVRSAAEAHHGAITVTSEPGAGSTFTLHLPV
jgi:signal transduction histidine kinase